MGQLGICGFTRFPDDSSDIKDTYTPTDMHSITNTTCLPKAEEGGANEIENSSSFSDDIHTNLVLPNFISDLREEQITFEASFEYIEQPGSAEDNMRRVCKLPSTTFFITSFADEEVLINDMQVYFQDFFETNAFKLNILSPDFTTLPHVLCLKFPLSTTLHVTYSVVPNRKIYKRELPMASLDFSNLDFFDDKERPMELVEAIMKKQNLTANLVDTILSFSHSCEICKIIQPALLGECGGCSKTFHQCHVCDTIVCTSCHRFGDCCHNCKNFRCYLCSLKQNVQFKQCMFCSASMADFSTVFDNLSDSETSEDGPGFGGASTSLQ